MMKAGSVALGGLLEHERFIRRVVGGILRDEARVQDVVQETWIRALARRSGEGLPGRAWLARTARNLAISNWRSEDRRKRRETAAAADRTSEASSASLLRLEQRQLVAQAILSLSEPHRTVILLRYEEGCRVSEIAKRTDSSAGTVRSQLSRAHAKLRERLDESFGDRERWAVLAIPSAASPAASTAGWLAAGALITLGSTLWLVRRSAEPIPAVLAGLEDPTIETSADAPALVQSHGLPSPRQEPPVERGALVDEKAPSKAPIGEHQLVLPPFRLMDRSHYDDYERATFSFLKGLRDDPGNKVTRNDWDLQLSHDEVHVNMVADDSSSIFPLGMVDPTTLDGEFELGQRQAREGARVSTGQTYLVLTQDDDSDLASLIHVREHVQGKSALFDWISTDGSGRCKGSILDGASHRPFTTLLDRLREESRRSDRIERPDVHLQMRACAGGGNTHEASMSPLQSGYIDRFEDAPLDLLAPIERGERSSGYSNGGWIPRDKKLVITHATYWGRPYPNKKSDFLVEVGGVELLTVEDQDGFVEGRWSGRIEVTPGMERRTRLETARFEVAEVRLQGTFEAWTPPEGHGYGAENAGFFEVHVPDAPAVATALEVPEARFQLRAGAGGGNPNRIDLLGRTSIYVDHVRDDLLDLETPIDMGDPSEAHVVGGRVPDGRRFVVTRVSFAGSVKGDSNGDGYLEIRVGGKLLCNRREEAEPFEGGWDGEIAVLPGEESRTFVEVGNSSWADVWIEGHFEDNK